MNIRYYLQRIWTFVIIYSDDEHSLLFTANMNIRYYLVLMNIRYSLQRGWIFVIIYSENEQSL